MEVTFYLKSGKKCSGQHNKEENQQQREHGERDLTNGRESETEWWVESQGVTCLLALNLLFWP